MVATTHHATQPLIIPIRDGHIAADLRCPEHALGLVIFAHGSGSSRFSSRNRAVADFLGHHRLATLLVDLLTRDEAQVDSRTAEFRFDIPLLADRVIRATDWIGMADEFGSLPLGYFGASTGAAAALIAAAERASRVLAVVSRGGRPDLAGDALARVQAPTLLIVGGADEPVIEMNQMAMAQMQAHVDLQIVPGASHLFEEPGAMEQVMQLATDWFSRELAGPTFS
jgi:pimeloyl-ACP methyl ester carboxylesterase